jgi:RNA polymerase sigma-70 factor, ECF subfamily
MNSPLTNVDDGTLIELALAGQTECFTVLMSRHMPAVRRRITSLTTNTIEAEDLVQETLLKVWCHLSTFRAESTFRTWITRVAINEVLQANRRERSRPICQVINDFDVFSSPVESPFEFVSRAELARTIGRAVARLPAKYRQVMVLREVEQLEAQEIARLLQLSIAGVKTRLIRARLLLQQSRIRDWTTARGSARHEIILELRSTLPRGHSGQAEHSLPERLESTAR